MARNTEALVEAGQIIFGESWQRPLKEHLGLSDTARIRQWIQNPDRIPPGVWVELKKELIKKKSRIDRAIDTIGTSPIDEQSKT